MTPAAPAGVTVRIATPDDHEAISHLFAVSYGTLMRAAYEAAVLEAALPLMTRANPLLLASGTFFVADTAGNVVGCGGWTRARPDRGDVERGLGHVRHFATHPDHTGLGIGRVLYEACEKQALAAGVERFECYASLNAEGFYSALGFEALARIDVPLNDEIRLPAVRMIRAIG